MEWEKIKGIACVFLPHCARQWHEAELSEVFLKGFQVKWFS